jgi:hypothetical protein
LKKFALGFLGSLVLIGILSADGSMPPPPPSGGSCHPGMSGCPGGGGGGGGWVVFAPGYGIIRIPRWPWQK